MPDKEVRIGLRTDLKGTGLQDAAKGLDNVDAKAKASARSMDAMTAEARDLERALGALTPGTLEFEQTAAQLGLVRKELQQTTDLAEAYATKASGAAGATRNWGAVAGQAGYQVGDFAVQVGSGTSALTAFAQQGSQLLGMFGPGGAVLGAVVAIGAAVYNAFKGVNDEKSKAKELGDAIDELKKKIADFKKTRADEKEADLAAKYDREKDAMERQTAAVQRYIDKLKEKIQLEGRVVAAATKEAISGIDQAEREGKIKPADAEKQRDALRQRLAADELARLEQIDGLTKEAAAKKVEAAAAELLAANAEKEKADKAKEVSDALKDQYQKLLDAKAAMERQQQIEKAGGRTQGAGEMFMAVDDRRKELDSLAPTIEGAGFPAGMGGKPETLALTEAKIAALETKLKELPQVTDDATAAFERARDAFKQAKEDLAGVNDRVAGESAIRGSETITDLRNQEAQATAAAEAAEKRGADAVLKEVQNYMATAADGPGKDAASKVVSQIEKILSDGLQAGEGADIQALANQISAKLGKNTTDSAIAFNNLLNACVTAANLGFENRRKAEELNRRIDELAKRK